MLTLSECALRPFERVVGKKDPLLTHNQEVMHDSKPATKQPFCQIQSSNGSQTEVTCGQDFGTVSVNFLGFY